MATTPSSERLLPKNYTVTSSFLNQLQTEWNEFLLEVSHSTPVVNVNITATSFGFLRDSFKRVFTEHKHESIHSFGENLIIPVPFGVLKRLFSPTKFTGDDESKIEIFNTIKKDPALTSDASRKLKKLLFPTLESSCEVSDWPSPDKTRYARHSAPSRLCPRNQRKAFAQRQQNVNNEQRPLLKEPVYCPERTKSDTKKMVVRTSVERIKPASKNAAALDESYRITNARGKDEKAQQYSSVYDLIVSGSSDSVSLFYDAAKYSQNANKWKPTVVFTYFGHVELAKMYQIVKELGYFRIENTVTSRTTHVICGTSRKTMNLCKAVARGCWILDKNWIFMSANENRWLMEERFELSHSWSAIKENRLKRQECGRSYRCDVFEKAGGIYVSKSCTQPAAHDLEELITLAGGSLVDSPHKALIKVGSVPKSTYVKEVWILNCVLRGTIIDTDKYLRDNA